MDIEDPSVGKSTRHVNYRMFSMSTNFYTYIFFFTPFFPLLAKPLFFPTAMVVYYFLTIFKIKIKHKYQTAR